MNITELEVLADRQHQYDGYEDGKSRVARDVLEAQKGTHDAMIIKAVAMSLFSGEILATSHLTWLENYVLLLKDETVERIFKIVSEYLAGVDLKKAGVWPNIHNLLGKRLDDIQGVSE